jgi:hypothetical protein
VSCGLGRVEHETHYVCVDYHLSSPQSSCCGWGCRHTGARSKDVVGVSVDGAGTDCCISEWGSDEVDGDGGVMGRGNCLCDSGPDVGVGPVEVATDDNVGEGDYVPASDGSVSRVPKVGDDAHASVLVLEHHLIDDEGIEAIAAGSLEASQGESVAQHVDGSKSCERDVFVVVLIGSVVVGVEGVEVDQPRGQFGDQRGILAGVLEVGLCHDGAD